MKPCPFCAEPIGNVAKCPYCGEGLGRNAPSRPRNRGASSGPPCPKCGGRKHKPGPWPWYLGTVGAMIVRAVVCVECGHHYDAKKPNADLPTRKRNLAIILNGIGALGIAAVIGLLVLVVKSTFKN